MSNIDLGSKPKAGGTKPNEQQKKQIAKAIQGFKTPNVFGPIAANVPLGFDIIYAGGTEDAIAAYDTLKSTRTDFSHHDYYLPGMVNLSGYPLLGTVTCYNNFIVDLNLDNCPSLISVECETNAIKVLSIDNCPSLDTLSVYTNNLTALDTSGSPNLTTLGTYVNRIEGTLDLTLNPLVTIAPCGQNYYTDVKVKDHTNIYQLWVGNNKLTSLDVSGCTSLTNLYCGYDTYIDYPTNTLASINLFGCSNLSQLHAYGTPITSIDFTGCDSLDFIGLQDCINLNETGLVVPFPNSVSHLIIANSDFTTLDISNNTTLIYLNCYINALTETAVDNIIIHLNANGNSYGVLTLSGGTNAAPSAASAAALANLQASVLSGGLGWTVITN